MDGWRILDDGSDLGGINWTSNDYDDSLWRPGPPPAKGPGLFGFEDNTTYPYPIQTPLERFKPSGSAQVITHYFRTTFQFDGSPVGVALVASNLVDDGVIVYLNGVELYRLRMPSGPVNANTLAISGPATEGIVEAITNLGPHVLRQGENVLAAELHQSSAFSWDAVFGMSLAAIIFEPPRVVEPPLSQTIVEAKPLTLSVNATGEHLSYQWYKNETPILGATSPTYKLNNVPLSMNGSVFHVVVSNIANAVRSSNAVITVIPDTFGPKLVSAVANPPQTNATATNYYLNVTFDEPITMISATNAAFYRVTLRDGSGTVGLASGSRVLYNGTYARLSLEKALDPTREYVLTVSGMVDAKGNVMATNSQIGMGQIFEQRLFGVEQFWRFSNPFQFPSNQFDPCQALGKSWREPDFDDSTWEEGQGIFYFLPETSYQSCLQGQLMTPITHFKDLPTALFRTRFEATSATRVDLQTGYQFAAGAVVHLNGVEIYRLNMPDGPIACGTFALANATACGTNTVTITNLITGTNVMAVEVHVAKDNYARLVFGMNAKATLTKTPDLTSGTRQ